MVLLKKLSFLLCMLELFLISNIMCRKVLTDEQLKLARKYLDDLTSKDSETWINPHDMFVSQEVFDEKTGKTAEKTKIIKNAEFTKDSKTNDKHKKTLKTYLENSSEPIRGLTRECKTDTQIANPENFSRSTKTDLKLEAFSNVSKQTNGSRDFIFLLRWLKMFLGKISKFANPNEEWEKNIILPFTNKHFKRLNIILKKSPLNMMDVETIIMDILANTTIHTNLNDMYIHDFEFRMENDLLKTSIIILILLLIVSTILFFYKRPISTIFIILVVISVSFQWKQLYSEALAKRAADLEKLDFYQVCKQSKFGVLESLKYYMKGFFIYSGSCEKYFEAVMVDPIYEVNFLKAVSLTLSKFIFAPMETFSQSLNVFTKNLYSDLGWFESIVVSFFLIFLVFVWSSYRLRFPYFMAVLEPCTPSVVETRIKSSNEDIEEKLNRIIAKKEKMKLSFDKIEDGSDAYRRKKNMDKNIEDLCDRLKLSLSINNKSQQLKIIEPQSALEQLPNDEASKEELETLNDESEPKAMEKVEFIAEELSIHLTEELNISDKKVDATTDENKSDHILCDKDS